MKDSLDLGGQLDLVDVINLGSKLVESATGQPTRTLGTGRKLRRSVRVIRARGSSRPPRLPNSYLQLDVWAEATPGVGQLSLAVFVEHVTIKEDQRGHHDDQGETETKDHQNVVSRFLSAQLAASGFLSGGASVVDALVESVTIA